MSYPETQYFTRAYLDSQTWQNVEGLAITHTPWGHCFKYGQGYWLLREDTLFLLEENRESGGQMLLRYSDGNAIGLMPSEVKPEWVIQLKAFLVPLLRHKLNVLAVFLVGFFISPIVYPHIFGYASAERCALDAKNKWAVAACYRLYPSIQR
jgi:hypothetical protein